MNLSHSDTHPNATFIYVCPIQGCSFAKQSNYQALCTHMTREHGLVREKMAKASGKPHQTREEREAAILSDEEVEEVDESEPGVKVIKITRRSKKARAAEEARLAKKAAKRLARKALKPPAAKRTKVLTTDAKNIKNQKIIDKYFVCFSFHCHVCFLSEGQSVGDRSGGRGDGRWRTSGLCVYGRGRRRRY